MILHGEAIFKFLTRFIDNAISLLAHEHIYIRTVLTKGTV